MKLTVYYTNGTKYTFSKVQDYQWGADVLTVVTHRKKDKGIYESTQTNIDMGSVAGVITKNRDTEVILKVKDCFQVEVVAGLKKQFVPKAAPLDGTQENTTLANSGVKEKKPSPKKKSKPKTTKR